MQTFDLCFLYLRSTKSFKQIITKEFSGSKFMDKEEVTKLNRKSVIGSCLLLSALFFMQTAVVYAAPTKLGVTFEAYFIDTDPTRVDTVHAGGRIVEFYWEGDGGLVSGSISGTIGAWTSLARSVYSDPYDPDHTDDNRLFSNAVEVFTFPTTLDGRAGSLTVEVRYRIDHIEGTRWGTWRIIGSAGGLEGVFGMGRYDGVFTGGIFLG